MTRRAVLWRRIGLALLTGYVVVVVLAAWRHEIRPAFLDRPGRLARSALASAGVRPGVAVFTADTGTAPDAKITASCLEVRVVEVGGATRRLYPLGEAPCPAEPPRLWVTGEAILLSRSAAGLRAAVAAGRTGSLDPSNRRLPRLLAESIADHFRRRVRRQGIAADRYALLWTESRVSYRTGARTRGAVALFEWRESGRVFVRWRPEERTLRERWPALGQG